MIKAFAKRTFTSSSSSSSIKVKLGANAFKTHLCESPSLEVVTTKEELLGFHKLMFGMRRMETSADLEYKSRSIRGFCHLYDGQEAIATGVEAALTRDDDWITTYRCHGAALARGCSYESIFAELFGFSTGVAGGKGGSMHMYNKTSNFYGGAAIVGAQVPIGAGLGFYHKYVKPKEDKQTKAVSIVMFGDGSANQGQVWEAANMAALWKIPVIFVIENNMYGMGTSVERSSANTEYYKQGNFIPGIKVDGMDALAIKAAVSYAKDFVSKGNGPMFFEAKTYRYHGHSMSDPGITYRSRDEVSEVRQSRDPIELLKKRIIDLGVATAEELKASEIEVRNEVAAALAKAKQGKLPDLSEVATDITTTGEILKGTRMVSEYPEVIRMPDRTKNIINGVFPK